MHYLIELKNNLSKKIGILMRQNLQFNKEKMGCLFGVHDRLN